LGDKAQMIVDEASYEVSDPTVEQQVVQLRASGANVFFMVVTPKFAAQAIRKAYNLGWKAVRYVGYPATSVAATLMPAGLEISTGIISSTYLKDPTDPQWQDDAALREWAAFMKTYYPEGSLLDAFNVNGYAAAQTLVQVLKQCGDDLTRENIMRQAANLKGLQLGVLLPGVVIDTSPSDYAPLESMQLMRFNGQQWVRFGDVLVR